MATWINKIKKFVATFGTARYGYSKYGEGTTNAGRVENKDKN
jgi:hypothetical protein